MRGSFWSAKHSRKPIAAAMFLISVIVWSVVAQADGTVTGTSPVGYWKTIDDKTGKVRSIVRIVEVGGELRGHVEKILVPPKNNPKLTCEKCPGSLKGKPVIGLEFLWGFKRDKVGWTSGIILDPEDGKTYHADLELLDRGTRLRVFGYIRIVVKIGRSQTWVRVSPAEYGLGGETGK